MWFCPPVPAKTTHKKMAATCSGLYFIFPLLKILDPLLKSLNSVFLKKKFLADTCPILGPLVPLFRISGDVSSGFQSQSGFCLIRFFVEAKCNVHSPRSTSGATPADLMMAGITSNSNFNTKNHEWKTTDSCT